MRRAPLFALTVSALVVAFFPTGASGRHTLAHRVAALEGKMSCLGRVPVNRFGDYAWFGLLNAAAPANPSSDFTNFDPDDPSTYPFAPTGLPLNNWGAVTGLDLAYGDPTPRLWMLAVRNTALCRSKFRVLANPAPLRLAKQVRAARLARAE
jgi:hypothetical protein